MRPKHPITHTRSLKYVEHERVSMPVVEVNLPDELLVEFEQLVDEEFISEEQAVEELLSMGMDAYGAPVDDEDGVQSDFVQSAQNNLFDTAGDPGGLDDDVL
ncbi:hypothetical protein C438_13771 [Haloferax denitrificans ATCC 35960]|uniref:CopG family transcriptional regulator n=3 Tax=Haloferax TaxID=2251 RepID=M0I065_9EURY|nr:hypothetical protein C441_18742 [Haloferax sulfurifontis ATCC BAA-897]EMA03099.1 hypothetical protein C438_13771 [Haloferax denitrificans ATCC 35960]GGC67148.1 hypothetical protein GCM10007209_31580 [Haloferax sulfurifontis]